MKTLVIADRRPEIDITSTVLLEKIELVITLGDLSREEIFGLENVNHIPKIGIYGNHDDGMYMNDYGILNIHLKIWDFGGIRFGGFQGCVRYKDNPTAIMYTQQEAKNLMQGFPSVDVFISHCPPRGINDEEEQSHQGFDALRDYIDNQQPKIWLHGHTYPTAENIFRQYLSTRVVYVFKYKIIDL